MSLWSQFIHSVGYDDSVSKSDCVDAQADLGHRCQHMPKDRFSHGMAQYVMKNNPLNSSQNNSRGHSKSFSSKM